MLAIALAVILLVGIGAGADHLLNAKKIHRGVSVGSVDVSGMTVDEARDAIEGAYAEKLASTRAVIYASEDIVGTIDLETELLEEEALAEQISLEQARENKQVWVADVMSLGAQVASGELAQEAFAVGRDQGGVLARLGAFILGKELDVRCSYDPEKLDALILDIDQTLGTPRIDANVAIRDGEAVLVEGQDGVCMDREDFIAQLDAALLASEGAEAGFVAKVAPSAMRITSQQAQAACDYLNSVLSTEVSFVIDGQGWGISKSALASWVVTEVVEQGKAHALDLRLSAAAAKPAVVAFTNEFIGGRNVTVDFEKSGGNVMVLTDGKVEIPRVDEALSAVDEALFGAYRETLGISHDAKLTENTYIAEDMSMVQVTIQDGQAPEQMSFEDAFDLGLITAVSSFTTTYNNNESTQNRVHNIHLAADLISNSIVQSGGGSWSFNDRAGDCNAERGFLGAGVIIDDELQDAVGGGICQVATTVFNAVYDGGYGIIRRHNHSLHLDAYPAGRDAAVSYPDLDFVWQNDTDSDVLLRCSYTDDSLTVTLYGVDPGYDVTHVDGEWKKTKDHATKKVVDETLSSGRSYVETEGTDAMQYAVFRTVTDAAGQVVYEDSFYSSYGSVTEVIRVAPDYVDPEKAEGGSADG